MDRDDVVSWQRRTHDVDAFDSLHPSDTEEAHVLAVDDSLVDRKVIERLLRISSFRVTTVESGSRALQFLGLDEDKSSGHFDESSALREIPVVIMSSEKVLARIDRCLEEGAEEFIVKPVKLSDVKRLKAYMRRDSRESNKSETGNRANANRKLREEEEEEEDNNYDESDLSASSPSPPACSVSSSPPSTSSSCSSFPSSAAALAAMDERRL
ncbi:hypothetical protein BT93_B2337 [Corymbia citriodora subsp. variegata]|nr:hypothetical protein BT93_B2337 [Corymbia citriodora subsp. variegata]